MIWGNNLVDGTRAALGPDYDVGRGGVAAAGGACCIGIRGALEVEGRKVGSIAKLTNREIDELSLHIGQADENVCCEISSRAPLPCASSPFPPLSWFML